MQSFGNDSVSSASLQQSLSTMALALSCVAEAIVWTDGDGLIQGCNAAFEQLVDQTAADFVGQRLTHALPLALKGEPVPLSLHPAAQWLQAGSGLATQHRCEELYGFWRHDRSVTLAITIAPLPSTETVPTATVPTTSGVMLIMQDVTALEHPRSPQTLDPPQAAAVTSPVDSSKPNGWVANSLESMTDAFFTLDANWCFTYLNRRVEQLLQRSRADLLGKNVWSSFPEAVNSLSHREYQRAVDEQCSVAFETFYPPLDIWFDVRAYPIADGLAVYFQDISERKRIEADRQHAEAILRESEQRFRNFFNTTAVGTAITSLDGTFLQVNAAYCQTLGYTEAELLALTFQQVTHPDDLAHDLERNQRLLAGELDCFHVEKRYLHQSGAIIWGLLSVSVVRDEQQQPLYTIAQMQNISDRKQAEAALCESETRLRLALEVAQMSTWDWDIPNDTVVYAGSLSANTHVPSGTHPHAYASFLHDVHADDVAFVAQSLASALQGAAFNIEFRVNWTGETQHWVSSRGQVYLNPQRQPVRMLGVARDITPRKQAELALHQLNQELEQRVQNRTAQLQHSNQQLQAAIAEHEQTEAALRKSEERLRTIFDNAPIAISLADAYTYRIVAVNQAHHTLLGYSRDDLATMTYVDFSHSDEVAQNLTLIQQLLNGSIARFQMEKQFVKKNGDLLWTNLTVALVRDPDGRVYSLGMIEDITDRKHAQAALLESQQFLHLIMDSLPNKVFWKDQALRYLGCNRQHALDAGMTPKAIIGKTDFELPWAMYAEGYQADDRAVITSEQIRLKIEEPFTNAQGERFWLETSKAPLRDLNGTVVGVLGICVDITERKHVEESLKLTQFSVDRASDPIWWIEPDGSIYYVNDAACRDLGYSREEIIGRRVSDFSANLQIKSWADHWAMIKQKGAFKFESILRAKDGSLFPIEVSANYIELNHKEYYCNFVRNITDRKQAENQLKSSLKEKEILLKEIHHRVKNNLQTVYSLLNLQANAIQDPQVLAPLKDSQQRVKAMALIHEKLYQSESLARINFTDYVHHLVADLIRSYSINPAQVHVQIQTAKLELAIDTVLPCGLIMNELVSNALKYAFPGDRSGSIQISFALAPNHQYRLVIADNGVGIAESIALAHEAAHTNTLGLQLIQAFVQQLQGVVTLDRSNGTRFEIVFPQPA